MSDKFDKMEKFQKMKSSILLEYLAEKLKSEQDLSKYIHTCLNIKYLNIRRKEKALELKNNLLDIKESSNTLLKFKILIEKLFERSFEDSAKLSQFVFDNFLIIQDKLIEIFKENLEILRKDYENQVEDIKKNYDLDKLSIQTKYEQSIKEIEEFIFSLEANFYHDMQQDAEMLSKKRIQ